MQKLINKILSKILSCDIVIENDLIIIKFRFGISGFKPFYLMIKSKIPKNENRTTTITTTSYYPNFIETRQEIFINDKKVTDSGWNRMRKEFANA